MGFSYIRGPCTYTIVRLPLDAQCYVVFRAFLSSHLSLSLKKFLSFAYLNGFCADSTVINFHSSASRKNPRESSD